MYPPIAFHVIGCPIVARLETGEAFPAVLDYLGKDGQAVAFFATSGDTCFRGWYDDDGSFRATETAPLADRADLLSFTREAAPIGLMEIAARA